MNDPHVVALHYEIDHGTEFDYSKAAPLDVGHDVFDVRVEDSCVRFSMNEHFATERDARSAVDDYIHGWELDAALQRGPNAFKLRFCRSEIEDLHQTPGVICVDAGPVRWNFAVSAAQITIAPGAYPKPPSARLKRSPDVESMFCRYVWHREGTEPITTIAYFCLTVLESSIGNRRDRRAEVARRYRIDRGVLDTLARLSTTKGGASARKAQGVYRDLTQQESQFLDAAVRTIIRRAAEIAYDSDSSLTQITALDLPRI